MLHLRSEGATGRAHGMMGPQPVNRRKAVGGMLGAGGRRASGRIGTGGRIGAVGRKSRTRARTPTPATIGSKDSPTGSQPGKPLFREHPIHMVAGRPFALTGAVDKCSSGEFALRQKHQSSPE